MCKRWSMIANFLILSLPESTWIWKGFDEHTHVHIHRYEGWNFYSKLLARNNDFRLKGFDALEHHKKKCRDKLLLS